MHPTADRDQHQGKMPSIGYSPKMTSTQPPMRGGFKTRDYVKLSQSTISKDLENETVEELARPSAIDNIDGPTIRGVKPRVSKGLTREIVGNLSSITPEKL
jgi:hypothetical protein